VKVAAALINMILVIISALATNVAAYAQLSTELEPAHSITSQQVFNVSSKESDLKSLSTLVQNKQKQTYYFANVSFPVYFDTQKYHIDQQTKFTVKFKAVQQIFASIDDKSLFLPLLINNNMSEVPFKNSL